MRHTKEFYIIAMRALFAGICIGIAGWGFLVDQVVGMFLFIFGLATVVSYGAKLFTGMAGYVGCKKDLWELLLIVLPCNIVGCWLVALLSRFTQLPIHEAAHAVLTSRMHTSPIACGLLAIGCGILMTSAVHFARRGKEFGHWVPLLFAVPLFIHCGFPHCVADAFYYLTASDFVAEHPQVLYCYACSVIGNFVGCNIPRMLNIENEK